MPRAKTPTQVQLEQAQILNKDLAQRVADLQRMNRQLEIRMLEAHVAAATARIEYLKVTDV